MGRPGAEKLATYRCAPHVSWTVERNGLLLLNAGNAKGCPLGYPQAALWDLLSRGNSYRQVVSKMRAIALLSAEATERFIADTMESWVEAGLLLREDGDG